MGRDIVLAGFPGSGKSYFAKVLKEKYNHKIIELGDYVRKESAVLKLPVYDCVERFFKDGEVLHFVLIAINERISN